MRTVTTVPLWVVLLAMVAPSPAQGQTSYQNFGPQCAAGAFRACASVSVSTTYYADGTVAGGGNWNIQGPVTVLRIRISNPQGLPGFEGGPVAFKSFRIHDLEVASGSARSVGVDYWATTTKGDVTLVGGGGLGAVLDNPSLNTADGRTSLADNYDGGYYLFGCDVPDGIAVAGVTPPAENALGYSATCGGWITHSLVIWGGDVRLTKNSSLELTWYGWEVGGNYSDQSDWIGPLSCTTGVDCVNVVPEPFTITLLATGLAGLGLLRRRKKRDEIL